MKLEVGKYYLFLPKNMVFYAEKTERVDQVMPVPRIRYRKFILKEGTYAGACRPICLLEQVLYET